MPPGEVARWRRELRAFGRIRLTPRDGAELAEIVIHQRVRPLAALRTLVHEHIPTAVRTEPATTLATVEGELGAVVGVDTASGHHALGVIYGDDFQTIIHGRTARAEQRDRVRAATRDLVANVPLGLGQKRHRRFWYSPPPGWQGLARGLVTDWFPLDHPQNPATIKVLPARPLDAVFHADTYLHDDTFGEVAIDNITRTSLSSGAFDGVLACATSGAQAFVTAALEDRQYVYVLRLATTLDRLAVDEVVFQDLVRSCTPLPQPTAGPSAAQPMVHWAT